MFLPRAVILFMSGWVLLIFTGCATLDVTARKTLTPATEKQGVTLGIQAVGDKLQETLNSSESSLVNSATGQLFNKVLLLPKESRFMQPQEVQAAYGTDYVLTVGISDISVSGELNPIWFASLPLFFFRIYAPIVTFQPEVSLDVALRDAFTGAVLMQKQVLEASSDHYAPSNPGPRVKDLVSLTINNALVKIMKDAQLTISTARKVKK